jgi:hypothetical protein
LQVGPLADRCHDSDLDYLAHLAHDPHVSVESCCARPDGAVRVPACPDWDADDLLWHLAEVQWFWGTIVDAAG